ncbi:MAG: AMP-binding protein, partial [Verrucomicrobiota bacterium]
ITPSHLNSLLVSQSGNALLPRKVLFLGGEASSWDLIQRIRAGGACKVINHYGPTETTVGSLTFDVDGANFDSTRSLTVPIGRPIANTQVYLLDSRLVPVPIGVVGELFIGGAGGASGYLNQPEQTAERFVRNPFSTDRDARLYRTGDLARYLADGSIEFLGRLDHQVKIRGFRVELAEIEEVLSRNKMVQQAAVIAHQEKTGDKKLVAYFVPTAGSMVAAEELRGYLTEQLPDYMVPSVFIKLEKMPLTPNGKMDRRALPNPDEAIVPKEKPFVAPRNSAEETLAGIWAEVLKADRVGIHDNFFELGGHSLLATQVIARIRAAFEIQIGLRTIFESPTVAKLAEIIVEAKKEQTGGDELDSMLVDLEGMSDEEAERLLADETKHSGA